MKSLVGKYISILGASTSTFDGISNDRCTNATLVNNAPYYPKDFMSDISDTWWMKTIKALGLRLCVNNSWSGSCVTTTVDGVDKAACMKRSTELHNDNLNVDPDIIVLIIGGNDALRGYEIGTYNGMDDIYDANNQTYIGDCTMFGQAYATMVHKVKSRYQNADIYVCSMLHWNPKKHSKSLVPYNAIIQKIADDFQITYVDFYNETDICPESASDYLYADGVHPNKYGFEQMSECLVKLLRSRYDK